MKIYFHIPMFMIFIVLLGCNENSRSIDAQACDFIQGLETSENLECGFLEVPENHQTPSGRKIQISYVIIKAKDTLSSEYPMIHLTGGPGGATLSPSRVQNYQQHEISAHRDVILFDQRGIGHSSPLPDLDPEIFEIMAQDLNAKEELEEMAQHMDSIRQNILGAGIGLQYYNSYQSASDIGMLMKALNYEKYYISGGSYGTRLARIAMEMYPEYIHGAILNSPNPPGGDFLIDRLSSYSLALSRVFEFCAGDPACREQYPDLRNEYLKVLAKIEEEPIRVIKNGTSFIVNPQDAIYILRRQLYRTNARSQGPALIREFTDGGGPIMENIILSEYSMNQSYNFSMWLSVERYEFIDMNMSEQKVQMVYDSLELLPAKLGLFNSFYHAGKNWHHATMTAQERDLQVSEVPAIVFVNHYDPVTPPINGYIMCETISNCQLFIMDEAGHGGGDEACRARVMNQFMENPGGKLDTSCLNIYTGG